MLSDPSKAYAICTLILCLNMTVLWLASGAVRGKTKTTPNPEDAKTVVKGSAVADETPPEVARVLRAHTNTVVNTVPFLFVAQVYVAAGASGEMAWALIGTFTAARVLYSFFYLNGVQPWRTLIFGVGVLATLATMVHATILLLG
ncbi:MAG: MAPEG family protein [Myxococcales bacterium]|nr:MAPEG family protein [Myxococcales bacterium]MCB9569254.1 MAPEG family protein [Myxococcales bacterium]MCB9705851.1 MAPEG family protein [Myxococcales bacterium]